MKPFRRRWAAAAGTCAIAATIVTIAATAFTPEDQPIAWIAQPELSSYDLSSNNETIFITDYEQSFWSGNIFAYRITSLGQIDRVTTRWTIGGAAQALAEIDWNTSRKIVTRSAGGAGVPFRWANLSGTNQTALGSQIVLNYLRGDRTNESPNGANLRSRRYVLGDIIRSKPHYVAGPTGVVYVGANDGMLHAFDASNGYELYAYVPSMLIPKMKALAPAVPTLYTHTHFVDASPNSGVAGARRVLAGGLGAGGQGLWALDITSDATAPPATEADAATRVLWEITPAISGFADLGYTYGEVRIRTVNTGATAVIAPNGYMSGTGRAVLYVIDALTGALIRAIDTGAGTPTNPNGLSSPALVDTNSDGRADLAYAGDVNGNLWKFDLSSGSPSAWSATKLYTTSPAQAITGSPAVSLHPQGGIMVMFGTGKVFTSTDMDDNTVHYLYGIRDGAPSGATALQTQTLTERSYTMPNGLPVRVRTATMNPMDWSTHRGWKLPLPAGERTLGDRTQVTNGRFFLHTYNPTLGADQDRRGENWALQVDYLSGGGANDPYIDMNLDGKINDADRVGSGTGPATVPVGSYLDSGVFSQPLLVNSGGYLRDVYSENANLPPTIVDAPTGTGHGVSGGHFDVDIYYPNACTVSSGNPLCTSFQDRKHVHEYDDKFNVTGVNMLNASVPEFNLSNALPKIGATTPFKVLVMNQYLNPAAKLSVGGANYVSVKDYGGLASQADASFIDTLPSYTAANVNSLVMNLPLDAFASKDWWGNGDVRAGLHPTQTGCVNKMSTGSSTVPTAAAWDPTPGIQGERHNGALTVQLVRADTPPSALELNVAGKPEYGWRVRRESFHRYALVEWTYFWHHPNGQCYVAGKPWVKNAPQDADSDTKATTPPAGTADPRDGAFKIGNLMPPSTVTELSRTVTESGNTLTLTIKWSDNTVITLTFVDNGNGTMTVTQSDNKGNWAQQVFDARVANSLLQVLGRNSTTAGALVNLPSLTRSPKVGRLSWREAQRE